MWGFWTQKKEIDGQIKSFSGWKKSRSESELENVTSTNDLRRLFATRSA